MNRIQPTYKQQIEALKKSIEKWKGIIHKGNPDDGVFDCALCELNMDREEEYSMCNSCIIAVSTGEVYCTGIGYSEWILSFPRRVTMDARVADTEERKQLAGNILASLENLLMMESSEKSV